MEEQKLHNYLSWLKDRGQVFPTVSLNLTEDASGNPNATPPPETKAESLQKTSIRLLFVYKDALEEAESQMLARIVQALGLSFEDFAACGLDSALKYDPFRTVSLGANLVQIKPDLTIPHPRDMIADPQLKVSAWQDLQKLKQDFR